MTRTILACILGLLAFAAPVMAQANGLFARVSSVTGGALLSSGNGAGTFSLGRGYTLNPGDRVDTRPSGRVVIDLSDGSLVIVQPGTVLTIKDFRAAASVRELFDIAIGMVRVRIHHLTGKPNPYRMNSPTASVAVRGTEFDVAVDDAGATRVEVFEGAVEVARLENPDDRALIEAGGSVLVRPGHPLQLLTSPLAAAPARGHPEPDRSPNQKPAAPQSGPMAAHQGPVGAREQRAGPKGDSGPVALDRIPAAPDRPQDDRPTPSAPLRPEIALAAGPEPPLLYRFNAFGDIHFDSYENPAYAAAGAASEVRTSLYGLSPQGSVIQPLGRGFVAGGMFFRGTSGAGWPAGAASLNAALQADTRFASGSALLARRIGDSAVGFSVETMRTGIGSGLSESFVQQNRLTAGATTRLGSRVDLGVYARFARFRTGGEQGAGSGLEAGARLRGALTRNLSYGLAANLRSSTVAGVGIRTASAAAGLGYQLNRRTLLSLDGTAGRLAVGAAASPFTSIHVSLQRDITRQFFGTVSYVRTWRNDLTLLPAWRSQYAQGGVGWRFAPDWTAQYLLTRDNLFGRAQHVVALHYTLRGRE